MYGCCCCSCGELLLEGAEMRGGLSPARVGAVAEGMEPLRRPRIAAWARYGSVCEGKRAVPCAAERSVLVVGVFSSIINRVGLLRPPPIMRLLLWPLWLAMLPRLSPEDAPSESLSSSPSSSEWVLLERFEACSEEGEEREGAAGNF